MTSLKKIILFLAVLLLALILNPSFSNAANTTTVDSEQALIDAITKAGEGDVIELTTDISLTKPIEITEKNITIDGKGKTIKKDDESWQPSGNNGTLITVGIKAKVTLKDLTLKNSQKYGVQAYSGGHVILDGVTISGCSYGGILVNAGTIQIKDLSLGKNGQDRNNGIEIGKGASVEDENLKPAVIMDGKLSSTEKDNVLYIAENDSLKDFEVENTENSTNKILASGNKVVITDENNNVIFESNENTKIKIEGEDYAENVKITIKVEDETVTMTVKKGDKITEKQLKSEIDLEELDLGDYSIKGFYTDKKYKTKFDFSKAIEDDTTIYTKLELIEEEPAEEIDDTPRTGIGNNMEIAISILAISILSLVVLRKNRE